MKELLPSSTDKLFQEESDTSNGAWMKNPANKFFLYSEGYLIAANMIYESIKDSSYRQNTLVYPMIFNYRQFIELRLKELTIMGNKYLDRDKDFEETHKLKRLWDNYRNEIITGITEIEQATLDNVERLIEEFEAEDPQSMNYRYPVQKLKNGEGSRQESLSRDTLDLKNFKATIDKLIYFFEWQWDLITHTQDMKNDQLADMLNDMRESYH
jgi:hypothetical protein